MPNSPKLHFNLHNLLPFLDINTLTKEHDSKQAGLLGNSGEHTAIPRLLLHTGHVHPPSQKEEPFRRTRLKSLATSLIQPSMPHIVHPCNKGAATFPFQKDRRCCTTCGVTEPIWKSQMPTATAKSCHLTAAVLCPIQRQMKAYWATAATCSSDKGGSLPRLSN